MSKSSMRLTQGVKVGSPDTVPAGARKHFPKKMGIFTKWRLTLAKMLRNLVLLPWQSNRDKSNVQIRSAPASAAARPKPKKILLRQGSIPIEIEQKTSFWSWWSTSSSSCDTGDSDFIDQRDEETKRRDWTYPVRGATLWVALGSLHADKGKSCEDRCVFVREMMLDGPRGSRRRDWSPLGPGRLRDKRYNESNTKVQRATAGCFAAIDGHGGDECAAFLSKCLPSLIEAKLRRELGAATIRRGPHFVKRATVAEACRRAAVDALREAEIDYREQLRHQIRRTAPGACIALAVVFAGTVAVANIGDTRCILLFEDGSTETVSILHRADKNENEAERIRLAGGKISENGRVADGLLEPSRTIGDFDLKDNYPGIVSAEPSSTSFLIGLPRSVEPSPTPSSNTFVPVDSISAATSVNAPNILKETNQEQQPSLISNSNTISTKPAGKGISAMVLASDGVCDTLEPSEIATFVLPKLACAASTSCPDHTIYGSSHHHHDKGDSAHQSSSTSAGSCISQQHEIAKGLVEFAKERGSTDDASAVVLEFWPPPPLSPKSVSPVGSNRHLSFLGGSRNSLRPSSRSPRIVTSIPSR